MQIYLTAAMRFFTPMSHIQGKFVTRKEHKNMISNLRSVYNYTVEVAFASTYVGKATFDIAVSLTSFLN
jgi:hypothetical protein